MKKLLLITGAILMFLAACKKTDSPDNSTPPLIELGPNTVIIDNTTSQTVQSVDSTHVVFDGNTEQLQRLVTGNIIVSAPTTNAPTGFLRKISSIQKNGTIHNILTTEAPLTEAFKNLHIDFTTAPISITINPPDIVLYDSDGNNGTTSDQIKVKVNSILNPKFHIKIDITNFKLDYAKIEGNFEGTLNTSITAGGSIGNISKEINIFSQPIGVFAIPGTPIVLVSTLRVSLGASGSINIEVVASDTKTSNINPYIEYKNNNWDKGFTRTMENQFIFSGLSGNANAKVYIEPAIDFKLWGSNWAKGSIISQGYLKASGQLLPTPDCELKAGISAGAEANLKFFGWTFSAASYPDIFDFSKVLYTCSAPNTQLPTISTTSVTGITSNSAISGGNVTNIGASTVSARGICWGTSPHPTTSNNITTNGSGIGSFNSIMTGLAPNTTYYLRAYATNSQGTNYGNEIIFTTVAFGEVLSPTGRIWMDRNLGASQVATSSNDHLAYGSLYQWGRGTDGHQLTNWTSSTIGSPVNGFTTTQATSHNPGHNLFIEGYAYPPAQDWLTPSNDNLWQGVNGINNPCPAGFRLPTYNEFAAEIAAFPSQSSSGAFASVLKLPVAGRRLLGPSLIEGGSVGYYWISSVSTANPNTSQVVIINQTEARIDNSTPRTEGFCVRCIKN